MHCLCNISEKGFAMTPPSHDALPAKTHPSGPRRQDLRSIYALGIIGTLATAFSFYLFFQFWKPLIIGGIAALLLKPLYGWILKHVKRPAISAFLVCATLILAILIPISSTAGVIISQIQLVITKAPEILVVVKEYIHAVMKPLESYINIEFNLGSIAQYLLGRADEIVKYAGTTTILQANVWGEFLLDTVIMLLTLYFCLKDGAVMKYKTTRRLGLNVAKLDQFFDSTRNISKSIIIGTFAAALVQALIICAAFAISGIPAAAVAFAATFIFSFVPLLGSWPLTVVGVLYGWTQGDPKTIIIVLVFGVIAGVADNLVRVLLSVGEEDTHPLFVLIAILAGISVWGGAGVIFGPLVAAVMVENSDNTLTFLRKIFLSSRNSLKRVH